MADLDEQLLALAGDDSSENEDPQPTSTPHKAVFATTSSPKPSSLRRNSTSKPSTNQKMSHKGTGSSSRTKRSRREDSEEGEASSAPPSPDSLQSAPMSESESDTSPNIDNGIVDYPLEGKFKSEKDRAEIMALSEVQRESILAERAQEHETKMQNEHLRRLVKRVAKADTSSDGRKRKADSAELEDRQRKSSRQKTTLGGRKVGETSGAIEAYKRQREEKTLRDEQRKRDGQERRDRKNRGSHEDGYSDADADGESEVEWDHARAKQDDDRRRREEQPADMTDFQRVRIGRDNFAKVCFYPGFDDAIKNCYVRVNIGVNHATNDPIYRMAKIAGFGEGRPYAMEGSNGKPFSTSQYAHVTIGNSTRTVPFIACSTARFTELDFNEYKNRILADDLPLPTKSYLISKIDDINKLINHQFTAEEIQQKLERSGVIKARYATIERAALLDKRRKAESRGDEAVIAKCNAELAELDGPKLAFGTSLYKEQKNAGLSQQERLAELNRANRKANTEDVRKAQRAEKRAEAENRLKVERGDAVPNPFARVKTRPRTNYDASGDHLVPPKATTKVLDDLFEDGSKNNSRSGTPARSNTPLQNGAQKRNGTPQLSQEKVNGLPKLGRRAMDDDIIGAMDLGIEIDI